MVFTSGGTDKRMRGFAEPERAPWASETFFHLLEGFGERNRTMTVCMNPLPITRQVNDEPSGGPRAMCSQPAGDCAVLKRATTSTKRTPTAVGRGAGSRSVKSQRRRSSLYQYASRGRKCQCAFSRLTTVKSEIQEAIFWDYGG